VSPPNLLRWAAFALSLAAPLRADGPYFTAAATETWQSNVNNAPPADVTRSAWTTELAGEARWLEALDFGTLLTGTLRAAADDCTTFHGLDLVDLDASLAVRHKFGLGAYATAVSLALAGSAAQYDDTERSFASAALALRATQRLTDALQVEGTVEAGADAARNPVFSGSRAEAGLTLNWDVTETWRVKLIGGWRDGDVVTTYAALGTPGNWYPEDPGAYAYARPWKYVPTYGAPYLAYRLRGRTLSWGAALAPALGEHTTLLLQVLRAETQGYDLYFNTLVTASVAHEF